MVSSSGSLDVSAKPLAGGDVSVALFNETGSTATISRRRQPDMDALHVQPAHRLLRQPPDVSGRQRQPDHPWYEGGDLAVQRPGPQQWTRNSNGTITGVQSGLCLDVTGGATADGALAELWTCNGGGSQRWTLG
ncbi:hypothetical protein GCM10010246_58960 [Streptomyces cuspidosporus]|uniref:Ricin B lectin domain-containing protein n=1 Tax=Streptomyces cuspidosporus TaxID=66882 RepID=A0ABP5TW70_9ACTN